MTGADPPRYRPEWLDLREPADAAARDTELVGQLVALVRGRPADAPRLVVHDLGAGTGAMGRWLAGHLPGPQQWVLHDRDPDLLAQAAARMPATAGGGEGDEDGITAATRCGDLAALSAADLAGAWLVTASALLDLLTRAELDRLADACAQVGCPALLTLSVDGQAALDPPDPLDRELGAAFNAHQRRQSGGRRLLGPDAPDAAAEAFAARGARVVTRPSPWRLGPEQAALTGAWLRGWVAAACAQRPDLASPARAYLERRLAAAAAGELRVTVGHRDLLAYPPAAGQPRP